MNIQILPSISASGVDDLVVVPRGHCLAFCAVGVVELRHELNGDKITLPSNTWIILGESHGQTVYLRAAAGTLIELALT